MEKLVPFNLEEARREPSRVRHYSHPEPYSSVEFTPQGTVVGIRGRTANTYTPAHYAELRLVAKPAEHRFVFATSYIGNPVCWREATFFNEGAMRVVPSAVRLEADGTIVVTE